ncbi:MAG: response regulator transcription factor [Candidatus Riflebacteria bacterium]|nr:response regulator transcription factor [Candidatus Riflebacteria bacterium]
MDCRIVLADDHSIFREGLKSLLAQKPEWKVVGEARNGVELLALVGAVECDLVVLDIAMPEMDGLQALRELRLRHPQIKVLVVSMLDDYPHFAHAKTCGASGYLSKSDAGDELLRAIERVMTGRPYVSPSVSSLLAERQLNLLESEGTPSLEILTKRERQVLGWIARGMTNKKIAAELGLSIHTVENHRAHLMEKLGMKNTVALIRFAIGKGLT